MTKRHNDALGISQGACNPHAIVRSLIQALNECRAENLDTDSTTHDPAIQLIVSQLAYICGVWDGVSDWRKGSFHMADGVCQSHVLSPQTASSLVASEG